MQMNSKLKYENTKLDNYKNYRGNKATRPFGAFAFEENSPLEIFTNK